ncbi:MAG: transposase [Phycisphaeraceae bacterium]|nr:transposase [Phycisphaeraceae bacterium]
MPRKSKRFFRRVAGGFAYGGFDHFWQLVLALTIGHAGTIERLAELLRGPRATHRTNHGEFLWRSDWDEAWVLREIALDLLRRLDRMGVKDQHLHFIIDDTQTLKRAKKMEAVGKLYHHATGTWGRGHTIVKACLHVAGVTIPWASVVYVKKDDAPKLGMPYAKLTRIAARMIREAELPADRKVTVLFDAFYLCPAVVKACEAKGWRWIGVGKSNRNFRPTGGDGTKKKLGQYGANVLRRDGKWRLVEGLRSRHRYRLAERAGHLNGIGQVKAVFSRRRSQKNNIALITNDTRASATAVVRAYLKRWAVELLIKDEKQHLGLGDYRVKRYRAVVRHLHLVDCAHACLTHLALDEHHGAQGDKQAKSKPLRLPPISQLKSRMRQAMWREAIEDVVKVSHERPVIRRLEKLMAA